jgi:mannose-1-phosphate guanylyltransferase
VDKLVFGRYCVDKTGAAIDVEAAALDWLITDTRKVPPEFDHPKHQAIRSLFNGK